MKRGTIYPLLTFVMVKSSCLAVVFFRFIYFYFRERAFVTLQEAIKLDFENWRVWENYLLLATDVGEFQEAMRSVNRMLDLRDKFSDVPVRLFVFVCVCFIDEFCYFSSSGSQSVCEGSD